jgi:hypothetical protein
MTQVETYAPNAEGELLQMRTIPATTSPTGMPVPGHQRVQFIPEGQAQPLQKGRYHGTVHVPLDYRVQFTITPDSQATSPSVMPLCCRSSVFLSLAALSCSVSLLSALLCSRSLAPSSWPERETAAVGWRGASVKVTGLAQKLQVGSKF